MLKTLGAVVGGMLVIGGCATMGASAPVNYSGGVMVNSAGMTLFRT